MLNETTGTGNERAGNGSSHARRGKGPTLPVAEVTREFANSMNADDEGEKAINLDELKRMLPELVALAGKRQDAADCFAAGVDAAAYASHASKAAIRKLVTAIHKDTTRAALADASEVADLIEAIVPSAAE